MRAEGPDVPPAVRAQILATEHWSLLATRSMTWSEVMSRISILLTRLRAAYVDLDPRVAPYLVTAITDDLTGVRRTYGMTRTRGRSHFIGSTGLFMIAVNAIVAGVFGALVTDASGGTGSLAALVGGVCLVAYAAVFLTMTLRDYRRAAGRNPPASRPDTSVAPGCYCVTVQPRGVP